MEHHLAEQFPLRFTGLGASLKNSSPINSLSHCHIPSPSTSFPFCPLYCSASPKCVWCAAAHKSRECPNRCSALLYSASTSTTEPLPSSFSSQWKCPCCLQPGVNVWHSCGHHRTQPHGPDLVPLPPPSTPVLTSPVLSSSPARCTALEDRFASFDTKTDGLANSHAVTASRISTLLKSQETIVSSVSTLAERIPLPLALSNCVSYFPVLGSLPRVTPFPTLFSLLHSSSTFVIDFQLKLLSWKVRGVTRFDKLLLLKAYVFSHQPRVKFLHEAFPGQSDPPPQALFLLVYVSSIHILVAFPPSMIQGKVYMGDFNAWHPELGDHLGTANHPDVLLLSYICWHHLMLGLW
ncbi:hypothetical protein E2C01_042185 [Portunus trituberculatus]|uniref:Uncharacterized protein n=1 Tax=Portunus trituberculatus TaxID=210409 RepID=A0A5B7FTX5_PORTR|nr:hypothetical protein [Portunus trituberculatus]